MNSCMVQLTDQTQLTLNNTVKHLLLLLLLVGWLKQRRSIIKTLAVKILYFKNFIYKNSNITGLYFAKGN